MYGILFPLMRGNPPLGLDTEQYGETNEKDSWGPRSSLADLSISGQLREVAKPEEYRLVLNLTDYRCRLRRSTQHLLGVYSLEFEIPEFFLDVDSSAARPGRDALE